MDAATIGNTIAGLSVFTLMYTMGLPVSRNDMFNTIRSPKGVALGAFGQIVILPCCAFAIALLLGLPEHIALGLVIIGSCPGGSTSNAFCYMARGDMALSVTLTVITAAAAFVTVPLFVNLAFEVFEVDDRIASLPLDYLAISVFGTTAVPLALGMITRQYRPAVADRLEKPLFVIALAGVLLPAAFTVAGLPSQLTGTEAIYALSAVLLNVIMVLVGFGLGWLGGLTRRQSRTLAIEVGIQNFGLMVLIVMGFLNDPRYMLAGVVYLQSMLLTGPALSLLARFDKEPEQRPDLPEQTTH
jgi:bile acid:Na+ symporter, BASS family